MLVERLLETLPPEAAEVTDDELFAELERRSADFDRGCAEAIPWSELRHKD
jgi:putative addiction module component (TIGR02574 family)